MKLPLKNDFQVARSHLIKMNIKMQQNYQMKSGKKKFGPSLKSEMGNSQEMRSE